MAHETKVSRRMSARERRSEVQNRIHSRLVSDLSALAEELSVEGLISLRVIETATGITIAGGSTGVLCRVDTCPAAAQPRREPLSVAQEG